jgi:hypothetical protein
MDWFLIDRPVATEREPLFPQTTSMGVTHAGLAATALAGDTAPWA